MKKWMRVVALGLLAGLLAGGCAPRPAGEAKTVYIAQQFGTAYVPIALMKEPGLLQKHLPQGVRAEWSQLGNTTAIREAMLAGKADVGCMAIPPFLIGRDGGMPWKICAGISDMPMGLVARNPAYRTLADITPQDRIALPQPGSVQHILLAMAAWREWGQADRFDNQLVTLNHPDGMSALLAGADVTLHFTTAPYLGRELQEGMALLLTGQDALGAPFTGIVAVAREAFQQESPRLYAAFLSALEEAMEQIRTQPRAVAELLAPVYEMSAEELLSEMTAEGAAYGAQVRGLSEFSGFMAQAGYLKEDRPVQELVFDGVDLP